MQNAAANRAADSRLNHVIKGLCGNAATLCHLLSDQVVADGNDVYAPRIQRIAGLLSDAMQWAHERQVFVALEEGHYQLQHRRCDLEAFLTGSLGAGEGIVEVRPASFNSHAAIACT